jgi:ABC-type phosphate transport system substrate-binding protein
MGVLVRGFGRLTNILGVLGLRRLERCGRIQFRNAPTPMLRPRLFIESIAACMLILAVSATSALADQLILQGSTTFNRQIVEPFQSTIEADSKHELTVIPNRTMLGVIALLEGRAHMAMISAPLKSEVDSLQGAMPGLAYDKLQSHTIQSTRVAIGVNKLNAVRTISIDQARNILTGRITNWSVLGGNDQPIRVVLVGGGGGVTSTVEAVVLGGKHISGPNVLYVKTAVQLVQVIEQEPNAIGFGQLLLIKQRGIPEVATDAPIEQQLSLVTFGDPTPAMQAVIDAARRAVRKSM